MQYSLENKFKLLNFFTAPMKSYLMTIILLCCFVMMGCDKDDLKKNEAEAVASFGGKLAFEDATFAHDKNETISIRFNHYVTDSDINLRVSFWNIEPKVGTTNLVFHKLGGGLAIGKPTSYLRVIVDEDGLAESYFTDSTVITQNTLTIDCISKNRVSGTFQVSYEIENHNITKFAPWVPDKFSLTEGAFRAID